MGNTRELAEANLASALRSYAAGSTPLHTRAVRAHATTGPALYTVSGVRTLATRRTAPRGRPHSRTRRGAGTREPYSISKSKSKSGPSSSSSDISLEPSPPRAGLVVSSNAYFFT